MYFFFFFLFSGRLKYIPTLNLIHKNDSNKTIQLFFYYYYFNFI